MPKYDYVVVGSGLAGLYASFRAAKYGTVALITKTDLRESNSYYAQGGIAAVTDREDAPIFHYSDTITAGRGLCDHPAVDILVNEGPERIRELEREGMYFDRKDGSLLLGLEGGHHKRRILHAGGDVTGMVITDFMINKVRSCHNIDIFEHHQAVELLVYDGICFGIRTWNTAACCEQHFLGKNTILASGGASAIYAHTSNPETTIGDGVAIAYNAGCRIADMEFIQFHPTTLYTSSEKNYLISEAVRGEGACLVNQKGERFMKAIHENAELAPRDIVARTIACEIAGQEQPFVYLTLDHLNPKRIRERFPHISEKCDQLGIDITNKIPVAPAAHYMVGGVRTDLYGRTNIRGLFVCGELASTGIMGANRLASNSLLECLVFGFRAIEHTVAHQQPKTDWPSFTKHIYRDESWSGEYVRLKKHIADIMSVHAGIIREDSSLSEGLALLKEERQKIHTDNNEYYTLLSNHLITVAGLIIRAALYRKESRGGHFRKDFPSTETVFEKHLIQQKDKDIYAEPVIKNTNHEQGTID